MPRVDLSGQRIGELTVIGLFGETVYGGRTNQVWLCRCRCGTELKVPQRKLPYRDWLDPRHGVTSCEACRSDQCVICHKPLSGRSRKYCSADCITEANRRRGRDRLHSERLAPDQKPYLVKLKRQKLWKRGHRKLIRETDPERHQQDIDSQRERRARRVLGKFMAEAKALKGGIA